MFSYDFVIFLHTWMSLAGFQSISNSISFDAPIRFKPTPPAFELKRNTTKNNKEQSYISGNVLRYHSLIVRDFPLVGNACLRVYWEFNFPVPWMPETFHKQFPVSVKFL